MKERILITGYNGELGSKTLKKLVSIGKSVIALDINDPTLHKCVKNDELLKSWGIDSEGKSNNALTILEIALIVVVSVAVVTSLGYVYYRWRLKLLWDKEIRSLLGQYVPLDDKAPATDNKKLNQSANATFQEEKNQK